MRREDNELLTRTNAGTPMGELFRRYWLPALAIDELPFPDCPPVRLPILGEQLVAFRDSEGQVGILDAACSHRQASLYFGRPEEGGIRCGYHGWKFDIKGQCVDIPSEPGSLGRFADQISLRSYPTLEQGGVIWVYMGPPEHQPLPPAYEWATLPSSHVFVSRRLQECNYLQTMEGGLDSSHLSILHRWTLAYDPVIGHADSKIVQIIGADPNPFYAVEDTSGGLLLGARRRAEEGKYYWRVTQFLAPCFNLVAPTGASTLNAQAWVPVDDENCWGWAINYNIDRPLTTEEREGMKAGGGLHVDFVPGTLMSRANKSNDYLIDRAAQRENKTFTGVMGIAMQDAAVQESQGRIADRTLEHLVNSDNGIIAARRMLIQATRKMAVGEPLPGIDPASHHCRAVSLIVPQEHLKDVPVETLQSALVV
jgi:phenylpropionate dioxygenase-like ring-hydroxylating dioxygenase large terminal subunit